MEDHEVLQHLLALEGKAAILVTDAEEEAERRLSLSDAQNRQSYEEVYAREVEVLEEKFAENLASVKEEYQEQLEAYHDKLKSRPYNMAAFSSLALKLFQVKEA